MILGPGWAFLGLLAVGLATLVLVPGCGLVVVNEAPVGQVRLEAPPLVEADPAVESGTAAVATVSLRQASLRAQRAALRIRSTCDGVRSGSGFALGSGLVLADPGVIPGAGAFSVASPGSRARKIDLPRVYRIGAFGVAALDGSRAGTTSPAPAPGASVAVVGSSARPRGGVVVDSVPGAPFGVDGQVVRLTTTLGHGEPGGPVVDAAGRIVAVAFATDPRTGLVVAAPIGTLRSAVDTGALQALPACGSA